MAAATSTAPAVARRIALGPSERLVVRDVSVDDDGTTFTRYARTVAGLDVINGDLVVRRRPDGTTEVVVRASDAPVAPAGTTPGVAASAAAARAVASVQGATRADRPPRLVVVAGQKSARLAWESVVVGAGGSVHEQVYTDAADNTLLARWSRVQADRGSGSSLYLGTVPLDTYRTIAPAGGYQHVMWDRLHGGHRTLDGRNQEDYSFPDAFVDADNVWGNGTTSDRASAAVDAHFGAATTYNYFLNAHGRDGTNGSGSMPYSHVHAGAPGGRYFFTGTYSPDCGCVLYGDGNGVTRPMVSLDVVGHEMTHAVIRSTANLNYSGESGALNEATADIFGTLVEFSARHPNDNPDYLLFEKPYGNASPAFLRRMDNPSLDSTDPNRQSRNCWSSGIGGIDVHYSSGVGNHFFYLLAEGSGAKRVNGVDYNSPTCNSSVVAGMGRQLAGRVWFRALTNYMTTTTTYAGARTATIRAASDLFGAGSAQCQQVEAAWSAVGVAATSTQCAGATPPSSTTVNSYYTQLFNAGGDNAGCADWSGGDGTQSIRLPSGKRAWFFADTYLNAPSQRPGGFNRSVVNNSVVVQSGSSLRTITGGNTCRERDSSIPFWDRYAKTPVADASGGYYWTGDARVVGTNVVKFYYRVVNTAASFAVTETAVASIPLSTLESATAMTVTPTRIAARNTPEGRPIIWGAALLDAGGYTYIYGWGGKDNTHSYLYLARSAPADVGNPARWSYSTGGDRWSALGGLSSAAPVSADPNFSVEAGFSVSLIEGAYWLVQHDGRVYGAGPIVAHPAAQPWGFTAKRVVLYNPPEFPYGAANKYQVVYEARAHGRR